MADKDRALELARSYNPAEFKMRPMGDIYSDARRAIADKYNAFMGHPVVQAFGEEPLEMTKAMGEAGWELAKQAPGAAKAVANYAYENPARASEKAVEYGVQLVNKPLVAGPAAFFWGPGGLFNPSEAKASELDPQSAAAEHARQQITNQEAQMMREGYAGGYCGGGEVREAHADGKKAVGPLAKAAESAMTKAAEKVLAEKMAERAARYVEDPEVRAANLAKWQGATPSEITEPMWFHGTNQDIEALRPGQAKAAFVTRDPEFANRFSKQHMEHWHESANADQSIWGDTGNLKPEFHAPNVMPMRVRAENPWDYENPNHVKAVLDALYEKRPLEHDWDKLRLKGGDWEDIERSYYQKAIRDLGHDSFFVKEGDVRNLGLYAPESQLKSASGNLGTFDPDIPRLTEAKGGKAG